MRAGSTKVVLPWQLARLGGQALWDGSSRIGKGHEVGGMKEIAHYEVTVDLALAISDT